MAKTKKIHPADQADRDAISTATKFNVHLRRSPTSKVNHEAATLAEAVAAYDALRSKDENRRPIIYAITPTNASIPVPQDMIVANRSPMDIVPEGDNPTEAEAEAAERDAAFHCPPPMAETIAEDDDIPAFLRAGYASKAEAEPVSINSPEFAEHPIAKANAASWPTGKGKRKPKVEKPADSEAPKADRKPSGKRAEILAAAQAGTIPDAPDFSAETHSRYRKKLGEIVALVEAGNIEALKAFPINPISSSPKAMDKYRNLAVIALEARASRKEAA